MPSDLATKLLAIETAQRNASVATLLGSAAGLDVLGEQTLPSSQRTAAALAPTLRALLEQASWHPRELQLVAVSIGPGSFTGLRIGVTTAKTLAYATRAEILGVCSLDAMAQRVAHEAPTPPDDLWVVMDAYRGELFAKRYHLDSAGHYLSESEVQLIGAPQWIAGLDRATSVVGPGLAKLQAQLPSTQPTLPAQLGAASAAAVARLAWRDYLQGRRDDLWQLLPLYMRPSAAEEKLNRS